MEDLMFAYEIAGLAFLWLPIAFIGIVASLVAKVKKNGAENVQLDALWKHPSSTILTLVTVYCSICIAILMAQHNPLVVILIGYAGDDAFNQWIAKAQKQEAAQ